ncbi:MAG TPA: Na+/H+ antiporter subunit E [Aquamicrobium sp.]|nr:Na+/H+ antiporter subunit E [Aquamicrobium sp.]
MSRVLPYPLMMASLVAVWLVLTGFTLGQFVVGVVVALIAGQGLALLHPAKPRLRRWTMIPKLVAIVLYDIVRSNVAVTSIILGGPRRERRSGFVSIPLDLRDPTGLAVLSVIITSTPGTAWFDYNSAHGMLLIHVFDLVDEEGWRELIKHRYEHLLMEIFE